MGVSYCDESRVPAGDRNIEEVYLARARINPARATAAVVSFCRTDRHAFSPLVEQPALEDIVRQESPEVADVGTVVHRGAAAVELDPPADVHGAPRHAMQALQRRRVRRQNKPGTATHTRAASSKRSPRLATKRTPNRNFAWPGRFSRFESKFLFYFLFLPWRVRSFCV